MYPSGYGLGEGPHRPVWIISKGAVALLIEHGKYIWWILPYWQEWHISIGEFGICKWCKTLFKTDLLGWPSLLCQRDTRKALLHWETEVVYAVDVKGRLDFVLEQEDGMVYKPSLSMPWRRGFLVALSLTRQTSELNSILTSLSFVNFEILIRFLEIEGTCRMFLRCKILLAVKKLEPTLEIGS